MPKMRACETGELILMNPYLNSQAGKAGGQAAPLAVTKKMCSQSTLTLEIPLYEVELTHLNLGALLNILISLWLINSDP